MVAKKTAPAKPSIITVSVSDCNAQTLHALGKNGYRLSAVDTGAQLVYFRVESGLVDNDTPNIADLLKRGAPNGPTTTEH